MLCVVQYAMVLCLSQVEVLLKWLKLGTGKQHRMIAHGLEFSAAKNLFEIRTRSSPIGAPNAGGESWRISTNNSLYLENGTR